METEGKAIGLFYHILITADINHAATVKQNELSTTTTAADMELIDKTMKGLRLRLKRTIWKNIKLIWSWELEK